MASFARIISEEHLQVKFHQGAFDDVKTWPNSPLQLQLLMEIQRSAQHQAQTPVFPQSPLSNSLFRNILCDLRIQYWKYFFPEELLVYDICKYHWCENIGRAHQSNNIMILDDLKNEVWYKKCHDPVCKEVNFKSDLFLSDLYFSLPADVSLRFHLKEEEEVIADGVSPHEAPPCKPSPGASLSADWGSCSDDACLLQAAEDAELADTAENGLLSYNGTGDEIPDELIVEVLQE
ncbi:DNA-directed primase/polymerase protein-like [Perognathus longimembris pacificus]|uniref:DNA-directed primase/polymerase protein-like n=1 Tax=Perognathus longimembris pacificus TaxID=214514 RepID=UPI002019E456|nr:DNA-directed primase/polymerase protein-like [Perognathus longimembris pacificus]